MYTYQMVGVADENGKTYECEYGTYSKEDGFKFTEKIQPIVKNGWRNLVNILFHEDLWKLKQEPKKKMTLREIEDELGYEIDIVDSDSVSPERKKAVDDTIDLLRYFGIHLDPKEYY